LLKLSDICE